MLPEGILLFYTNFSLVVFLSTMLTLSPSFYTTSISINTTFLPFYQFLYVSLTISHITLNQSVALMTLYKPRIHSHILF